MCFKKHFSRSSFNRSASSSSVASSGEIAYYGTVASSVAIASSVNAARFFCKCFVGARGQTWSRLLFEGCPPWVRRAWAEYIKIKFITRQSGAECLKLLTRQGRAVTNRPGELEAPVSRSRLWASWRVHGLQSHCSYIPVTNPVANPVANLQSMLKYMCCSSSCLKENKFILLNFNSRKFVTVDLAQPTFV